MNRWWLAWTCTMSVCGSAACGGGGEVDSNLCDIREASCQQNVFSRVARLRGDSGRPPRVEVITAKEHAARRAAIEDDADDGLDFERWVRGFAFFQTRAEGMHAA